MQVVAAFDARDGRGLAERAASLRERGPEVLLIVGAERRDSPIAGVVEAARVAYGGVIRVVRAAEPASDEGAAAIAQLRGLRFGDRPLALETLEERARSLQIAEVLVCEVDESGARLAAGSHDDVNGFELPGVGLGPSADGVARRAGARMVRRWLITDPLPDAASLRDRLANLARFDAADTPAVEPLRRALLRESLGAVARAARADVDLEALSRPRRIDLGGALAALAPAEAVGVALDAISPQGATRITSGERSLALVLAERPRRGALELRISDERGEREERVAPGSLVVFPVVGRVTVRSGRGIFVEGDAAGELGLVIDARPRPLELPERDGERVPLLRRWAAALAGTA
ncbi:MAG: hypothetical protein AUH85_11145 [Chloroflexi bacterium 13_1_40CM_4_68_4]|nr:MAG: hypothetical protein AUH85_11145 [Chloroflexi bacterium 13_1_40CM_4_68_4]